MIQYMRTELVPLTKDYAADVATMPSYRGERPLQRARLGFLVSKLKDGHFYSPRWSVVRVNGATYRINGQHSSTMLTQNDDLFPPGLKAIVDHFEADSLLDVATLFGQFDSRASVRSRKEIVNAHARVHEELDEMSPTVLSACVAGMAYALCDGKGLRNVSDEERAGLTHDYTDFVRWVNTFAKCRILAKAPVLAAIFKTYNVQRTLAGEFWGMVKEQSHPYSQHPTRILARFLLENTNRTGTARWVPRAFYVKCLHAWNAFRTDAPTSLKYRPDTPVPPVR